MFGAKVLAASLLSATFVISDMPQEVFAAPAQTANASAAGQTQAASRFDSVDSARKARRIDDATVELLRKDGSVDALVVFDGSAGRSAAVAEAGRGKGRAQRILDCLAR